MLLAQPGMSKMNDKSIDSDLITVQMNSLQQLKQKTQALLDCKATLLSKTEILDYKKSLLEETNSERQRLEREKRLLREMLQNVAQDISSIIEVEHSLSKESEELERSTNKIRIEQYEPLQDQVNEIRVQNGMPKLPHIQQELEARMAKILEERRVKWQESSEPSSSNSKRSRTASSRSR